MNERTDEIIKGLAPKALRLAVKVVRLSKGGFDKEERKELAEDLLDLALVLLQDLAEE